MHEKYEPMPLPAGVPRDQLPWEKDGLIHLPFLIGAESLPPQQGEPELLEGHEVADTRMDLFVTGLDVDVDKTSPWAVGPIIAPRDCCYIVGGENVGKTSLVVDILWGILAPESFDVDGHGRCLGGAWKINRQVFPHGSPVMFLNAETTSARSFYRKVNQRSEHAGLDLTGEVHQDILSRAIFGDVEDFPFAPKDKWNELADMIVALGVKALVIDPIFNFFDPSENGDATWVTRCLKPFIRRMKQADVVTFCLAHPSHQGLTRGASIEQKLTPFGTSQQKGVIDCSFGITNTKDRNAELDLVLTKSRSRDTQTWIPRYKSQIKLHYSKEACGYTGFKYSKESRWEYENPEGRIVANSRTRKFLAKCPVGSSFTAQALRDSGLSARQIKQEIPNLIAHELVTESVMDKPGAPKLWTWTEEGLRNQGRARSDWPDEVQEAASARMAAGYDELGVNEEEDAD